ncbi:MAG TPA: hypothetical protein ENI08_00925 [Candidatus Dependentiae bacterium]|nr:hypothetical protein [Candidatus Dependentiae bacterium]
MSVDVDEQKESLIQARLETSFLGTSILYWFGNLAKLNYKTQERWITYLQEYRGPHTIAFFITEDTSFSFVQGAVTVHIPDTVSHKEMIVLQQLLPTISSTLNKQFLQQLGKKQQNISLDLSCLLIHYALLIGKNSDTFFTAWLDHIMPLQTSLFLLSQHFFAKNTRLFFVEWLRIQNNYSPQFWIAFWSEQLWRATLWVDLASNKSYIEAKKIQFKLPFAFIKRDWKNYHADELQHAHQFVTAVDYHLKNNGSSCALDLFYSKFFLNQFA